MDGSASVLRNLRVYDGGEESRRNTSVVEKGCDRVRREDSSDWIGKIRDIKLPQGGRVSDLIKVFDNQSVIYDPGANLVSVLAVSMSLIGGGVIMGEPVRILPTQSRRLVAVRFLGPLVVASNE
jgi:hypothetical protein